MSPSDGPICFTSSRAQALSEGALVDVSAQARELAFRLPVALTLAVYRRYVRVPPGVTGQDEAGRLHDVLWMLLGAITGWLPSLRLGPDRLQYELHVRNDEREGDPPKVALWAQLHPGDAGEPVVTVRLPGED